MIRTIEATKRGELPGWRHEDITGRAMYLEALSELAVLLASEPSVE